MLVDGGVVGDPRTAASGAAEAERAGYDGVWSAEAGHDPFLPLLLSAEHTESLQLGTAIAVAFGRNPMTLATMANDLQLYSGGRFLLGLGSQIKPHIEKRYSMVWSHPAPRMREMVLAIRAIWECWQSGGKLDFRGDFYTHTLMTPFFSPGPNPHGTPKVFLAAVGSRMTEVAGEVADGLLVHPLSTPRYLAEVTVPALEEGMARAGKSRDDFEIASPCFIVTGRDEEQMAAATTAVKQQIAFYSSTPAYRSVLELHGWEDLQGELNTLSKRGEWVRMGELVDDTMLGAFAVIAEPARVGAAILDRCAGLVDRVSFYTPYRAAPGTWDSILRDIKSASTAQR